MNGLMVCSFLLSSLCLVKSVESASKTNLNIKGSSSRFNRFSTDLLNKQQHILQALEGEDRGFKFQQDPWDKKDSNGDIAGYGITAVLRRGKVFEKAAASSTITSGILSLERAKAISSRNNLDVNILVGTHYFASALSLVLHSRSPMVPTFRSDIRYFELYDGTGWFGGGADLTPYYLFDEDAIFFHNKYKTLCDSYSSPTSSSSSSSSSSSLYPRLKKWCDDYFFLPARGEHRGIGGIFFDDLSNVHHDGKNNYNDNDVDTNNSSSPSSMVSSESALDTAMKFTCSVCDTFMDSYLPIVQKRKDLPYTEEQRHWQLLRRGRYIEFNMLYDRGVKFGLVPGGRIEAVFVSCPPLVAWDYNHTPVVGSEEARLMEILIHPKQWITTVVY